MSRSPPRLHQLQRANTDLFIQPGIRGSILPAAFMGSPILDDDVAGVVAVNTFAEYFHRGAFRARPANTENIFRDAPGSFNGEAEKFGFFPAITVEGVFSLTPFFVYANAGSDSAPDGAYGITTNAANPRSIPIWYPDTVGHDNDYQHLYHAGAASEFTM